MTFPPALSLFLHEHTTSREWLSTGLWSGLVVLFVILLAVALVAAAALARLRAARRTPCPGCGLYSDPAENPVCPGCGRELKPPAGDG